jgi:hypothetical protein
MTDITDNVVVSSRPAAVSSPSQVFMDPTSPAPYMIALALGMIVFIAMSDVRDPYR